MELSFSARFAKSYAMVPEEIQRAFDKQSKFLLLSLRHPSLHAKKYQESTGLSQARVTRDWRFYFTIEGSEYRLHDIKTHPK
jgi:mRNA interferase RelE/StbE